MRNYSPRAPKPLAAIFDAFRTVASHVDLAGLVPKAGAGAGTGCARCGTCCSSLNPGLTDRERYEGWIEAGNPTALFFREVARNSDEDRWYAAWFQGETRLRLCPLLCYWPWSGKYWCAVYHLGPGHRPETCESFQPHPPDCVSPYEATWEM